MRQYPELLDLGRDLLTLLWPTACVSCGAPDRDCCARCRERLRAAAPLRTPALSVPCFARTAYADPARALLIGLKHGGRVRFARELGAQLRAPLAAALRCGTGGAPPLIVPAPSRPARTRERGFRHVELLIAAAVRPPGPHPAGGWATPLAGGSATQLRPLRALRTGRGRRSQVGLGPAERARNARRLAVRRGARALLRGREVVLVDDVLTTGATVEAAREALESAGARVVAVAVLCDAERRSRGPMLDTV